MIPQEYIQEVVARNDITEVIGQYVQLRHRGRTYTGLCPFHNEKTPSFTVYPDTQSFYCFGCGAAGDVINFVRKISNLGYVEAVKQLAGRAGMPMPEEDDQESRSRSRLLEINRNAARYFYDQLNAPTPEAAMARRYWREKRGLSDAAIRRFGLGYAPEDFVGLLHYLRHRGFTEPELESSGLVKRSAKGNLYDIFRHRVMVPIIDVRGNIIAFGGRVMDDSKPKYINSPETMVYHKSRTLFALNVAKKSTSKRYILCEGYMDVISMHEAGFDTAVCACGTALTPEQVKLLTEYADEVVLSYDSDEAGQKATERSLALFSGTNLQVRVLNIPGAKDPDEFIKNLGKEAFQERINQAENSFYFEIRILSEQYDQSDPEQRTKFHREIAQKLCEFSEDLERENYLQAIAEKYMIRPDDLRKMVIGYASQTGIARPIPRPRSGVQNKSDPSESGRKSQRLLITWIGDDPSLYTIVRKYISLEDFTEELYRKVAEKMFAELDNGQFQPAGIISMFEDEEEQRQAAELFHTTLPELSTKQERERAFHDILVSVKRNSYQYYMAQLGTDVNAVKKAVEGKKALEELQRARISLE